MRTVKTKYGILNGAHIIGKYITSECEYYSVDEISNLKVLDYDLVPLYGFQDARRKELPAIRLYKNGNIKTISLNDPTMILTKIGGFEVEKIVFYENEMINRIFLLDGKLSGYWSEDDEYNLAKVQYFNLPIGKFEAKVISLHFYKNGNLKSITFWPKERIILKIGDQKVDIRIGISLYEDGSLKSCEPAKATLINTPIGKIEAFDINTLGIHGENNSLKYYNNGDIKEIVTFTNVIEVHNASGEKYRYSPNKVKKYSGDIESFETVDIEFLENKVIINKKYEYKYSDNTFNIMPYREKKLTLSGDL
jgi:hypothetical protein